MRVPYRYPGSTNTQLVDIYTRLFFERIVFLDSAIDANLANFIVSVLLHLDAEDSSKPISLYINSPGDVAMMGAGASVAAGLAIYDTMQQVKAPIHTICLGMAAGTAVMLLSSGTKGYRACLPHAELVLNPFYTGTRGQATDIQILANKVLQDKSIVLDIFAKNTGQAVERLDKDTDRRLYLSPQEAKDYGLVDHILRSHKIDALAATAS
ncbi:ATP-dependent Clp protease proteolytic subunit [Leptolyngbya sp. AN02str]|uniref:ATP-dependent Clp protease proteolytic subunit n=1 Tax=Leptolyngbya sp. AN02str TaxID=3423363 RepID=UPI003D31ACC3